MLTPRNPIKYTHAYTTLTQDADTSSTRMTTHTHAYTTLTREADT